MSSGEWYACFDESYFQPVSTIEELVRGDNLAMLKE
jgi:hypothetical protein